jgi:hypothetical protein
MLNIRISPKCDAGTVQLLYAAWCRARLCEHASQSKDSNPYEGLEACRKNVVRTNNSRKLQYCKETRV